MKRSVKIAAKLHAVALVVMLLSVIGIVGFALVGILVPAANKPGDIYGVLYATLMVGFVFSLVCMLHVAMCDAVQRIERTEKTSVHDDNI